MEKHNSIQGILFRMILILGVALGVGFLPTRAAHAVTPCPYPSADYYGLVYSTVDSLDPGTLRGEIECGGVSTITFSPSLAGQTITLTFGELSPGGRDYTFDGSMVNPMVSISGGNISRVFNINYPATFNFYNLVIKNGRAGYAGPPKAGSAQGGGMYIGTGIVNLNNLYFTDNHTIADQSEGGAIYIGTGTLNIDASTFIGNSSTSYWSRGGAIYNNSASVHINNSTFTGNSAAGDSGGYGGAIYNAGNLYLNSDTFFANSANLSGGNIFNNNSGYSATVDNTIIAGSSSAGGNCDGAAFTSTDESMSDDDTCGAVIHSLAELGLGTLGYYGGPTQTIPLLAGSAARDAGSSSGTCPQGDDQRGIYRPVGSACDIGAFEYDEPVPAVIMASSVPTNGAILPGGINTLKVVFNTDISYDSVDNYLLVEAGSNGIIDTQTCRDVFSAILTFLIPVPGDDVFIPINSDSYDLSTYTVTLSINNGTLLPNGTYKLFVCGTTSITDSYGLKLNYGYSDTTIAFQVGLNSIEAPATGFAPNRVTSLPRQTTDYSALGDLWLEIPSLGVKAPIVGVPMENGTWDVSWLGKDAGWLNGSAFPTWAGNSVLTGHVYDAFGKPGPFAGINRLWYGSQIIVHAWGGEYVYEVRSILQVSPNDSSAMLKHQDLPWLTLVTCRGYNATSDSYKFRVLVRAVLVDVE